MRKTIIIFLSLVGSVTVLSHVVQAASSCQNGLQGYCTNLDYLAQAGGGPIPGLEFLGDIPDNPAQLFSKLFTFGVGITALLAFLVFTAGGVMYIVAGDKDPTRAKTLMRNALFGLMTALLSWLGLYIINPDLVKGININLTPIEVGPGGTSQNTSRMRSSLVEDQGGPTISNPAIPLFGGE